MILFAENLKVFLIKTSNDAAMLQNDLNQICDWCGQNKFNLNINKCKVMAFPKKLSPYLHSYYLNDLGIYFDKFLSFNTQCTHMQSKASSMLSFITRSCKDFKNRIALKSVYCAYVRSTLDSIVWSLSMVG